MLPRRNRLPPGAFPRSARTVYSSPTLTAKCAIKPQGPARAAVIISAKAVPQAVKRNRLKRQITAWAETSIPPQVDLLILVRSAAAGLASRELQRELIKIKERLTQT